MTESTIWWLIAGGTVALELATGTFYLLMLAIGFAAGAVTALLGAALTAQLIVTAIVGGGAVIIWHLRQARNGSRLPAQANPDVNIDIGEILHVASWNPDGTADVQYRGARWTAIHRAGVSPGAGPHRVSEIIGNRLLLDKT